MDPRVLIPALGENQTIWATLLSRLSIKNQYWNILEPIDNTYFYPASYVGFKLWLTNGRLWPYDEKNAVNYM